MFWFPPQHLSETFLILTRIKRDIIINVRRSSNKVPDIIVKSLGTLNFLDRFSKNSQITNSWKSSSKSRVVHADERTDSQTDMTKLKVPFRNFANVSKNWETTQQIVWHYNPLSQMARLKKSTSRRTFVCFIANFIYSLLQEWKLIGV